MFKTRVLRARIVMVDDRFKMGGTMYRINMLARNKSLTMLEAYAIENPSHQIYLELPHHTKMKIYNQK